jgi:hypothetical protein
MGIVQVAVRVKEEEEATEIWTRKFKGRQT